MEVAEGELSPTSKDYYPNNSEFFRTQILGFLKEMRAVEGWLEWKTEKLRITLESDIDAELDEFQLPEEMERRHKIATSFLELIETATLLQETEYYFRRFPFSGLPITRPRHLRNCCEMYFNRTYELKERLKAFMNLCNKAQSTNVFDASAILNIYEDVFSQELNNRNAGHHFKRFDEIELSKITLHGILSSDPKFKVLEAAERAGFEKQRELWIQRIRKNCIDAFKIIDFVAEDAVKESVLN